MKKNGFTLIELLGVIVIMAIVALITYPLILNIIENVKKASIKVSTINYIDAIENSMARKKMDDYSINFAGNYIIDENKATNLYDEKTNFMIDIKGETLNYQKENTFLANNKGIVTESCLVFDDYYTYYNNDKVVLSKVSCDDAMAGLSDSKLDGECTYANIYLNVKKYASFEALPSISQKNNIGVITEKQIVNYYISHDEPNSPKNGTLWINQGDNGDNNLSIIDNSNIKIDLSSCKQYDGTNWINKDCYIYHESKWNKISSSFSGDMESPVITVDPTSITLTVDQIKEGNYNFYSGVSATDNVTTSDKITIKIIQNSVSSIPGSYSIVYGALDEAGNMAIGARTVIVEKAKFEIELIKKDGGIIYISDVGIGEETVPFSYSISNDDFTTYEYAGLKITNKSNNSVTTLTKDDTEILMPKANISIEPIFNITRLYLFRSGYGDNTKITGGWRLNSYQGDNLINQLTRTDYLYTNIYDDSEYAVLNLSAVKAINVTDFSTLTMKFSSVGGGYQLGAYINAGSAQTRFASTGTFSVNISSVSGNQGVGYGISIRCRNYTHDAHAILQVNDVYLDR